MANIGETELFTASGVCATLSYPNSVVFGSMRAHSAWFVRHFLQSDHRRRSCLDSILDASPELRISGEAAKGVRISGTPQQIDEFTFRYTFEGSFKPGPFLRDSGRR
ncbi:MAG UNVERIFIED_CONTAM: hypothetical protein LVR18_49995 [Planctomycetaceae bacterium]